MAQKKQSKKVAAKPIEPVTQVDDEIKQTMAPVDEPQGDAVDVEPAPEPQDEAPKPEAPKSEGAQIAAAIVQGLNETKGGKKILITTDPNIQSMFSVVRNKQGEVMIRENATGVLSKVQLESLEEKEASLQGQEVEEI